MNKRASCSRRRGHTVRTVCCVGVGVGTSVSYHHGLASYSEHVSRYVVDALRCDTGPTNESAQWAEIGAVAIAADSPS